MSQHPVSHTWRHRGGPWATCISFKFRKLLHLCCFVLLLLNPLLSLLPCHPGTSFICAWSFVGIAWPCASSSDCMCKCICSLLVTGVTVGDPLFVIHKSLGPISPSRSAPFPVFLHKSLVPRSPESLAIAATCDFYFLFTSYVKLNFFFLKSTPI